MNVIEYIGNDGIKTTEARIRSFAGPKPGDVVAYPENAPYPFNSSLSVGHGRIAGMPYTDDNGDERVSVCCGGASVFWHGPESVSISGGPFESIKLSDLEATMTYKNVHFWNWGDNSAGADQGVYYTVSRPVFNLIIED